MSIDRAERLAAIRAHVRRSREDADLEAEIVAPVVAAPPLRRADEPRRVRAPVARCRHSTRPGGGGPCSICLIADVPRSAPAASSGPVPYKVRVDAAMHHVRPRRRRRAPVDKFRRDRAADHVPAAGDHPAETTELALGTSGTSLDTRAADHLPPCTAREGGGGAGVTSLDPEAT